MTKGYTGFLIACAIGLVLYSLAMWAGEKALKWANTQAPKSAAARALRLALYGAYAAFCIAFWGLVLFFAYQSFTVPSSDKKPTSRQTMDERCHVETDNRGAHVACD